MLNKEREYFWDKHKLFSNNKIYKVFVETSTSLSKLIEFWNHADKDLDKYYTYEISQTELFNCFYKNWESCIANNQDFIDLNGYISYLQQWSISSKYSDFEVQMRISSLIKLANSHHDLILLNSYSTLADVESIFVLPYKIDRQKYEFEERLNDVLARTLYNYQLTLNWSHSVDDETMKIIGKYYL